MPKVRMPTRPAVIRTMTISFPSPVNSPVMPIDSPTVPIAETASNMTASKGSPGSDSKSRKVAISSSPM